MRDCRVLRVGGRVGSGWGLAGKRRRPPAAKWSMFITNPRLGHRSHKDCVNSWKVHNRYLNSSEMSVRQRPPLVFVVFRFITKHALQSSNTRKTKQKKASRLHKCIMQIKHCTCDMTMLPCHVHMTKDDVIKNIDVNSLLKILYICN